MYWGPPPDHMDQKVNLKLSIVLKKLFTGLGHKIYETFSPKPNQTGEISQYFLNGLPDGHH